MPSFSSPPNRQAYYIQVWYLVRPIPYGHVATYGQIAKILPPPKGEISKRAGAERQRFLLEQEGVQFDAKNRIDLKKYGWNGQSGEPDVGQP